ncbi:MAG: ABC transporter permease [Epulopiscium sp.]|nr:ABC transporter permease [Candidatus Epulonipiscium sp.]
MLDFWFSVLEQGLLFAVMVLGVYITYKILDFPDLTVDGSFPLGAAVMAASLVKGNSPIIGVFLAFVAGMLAGGVTGFLHVKLKITNLLSGILVMIGLYSINIRIMGRANVPLFQHQTLFTGTIPSLLIILLFVLCSKILLDLFLKTKFGFLIKATGDNPQLVTSLGIPLGVIKIIALMISNGFVALSGALVAQHQSFADVGMGSGVVVMGLASIILGEVLLRKIPLIAPTTMAIVGSILYKLSIACALKLKFPSTDLKLITAVIVIAALSMNQTAEFLNPQNWFKKEEGFIVKNTEPMQNIL